MDVAARQRLTCLARVKAELETEVFMSRADAQTWKTSWDEWLAHEARWEDEIRKQFDAIRQQIGEPNAIQVGQAAWEKALKKSRWRFWKAEQPAPDKGDVAQRLSQFVNEASWAQGAYSMYVGMAGTTSAASAGYTLQALGIHRTFSWASTEDFPEQLFSVRGSKVIQNVYGSHLDRLAKMVVDKCDPRNPKTIGQLTNEIHSEWDKIEKWQAKRIARTEASAVWNNASYNAMRLNGVTDAKGLIAQGPSVGVEGEPVCPICQEWAASGPWPLPLEEIPPIHPNCRCTLAPELPDDWLPPDEPWTGNDDVPVCGIGVQKTTGCIEPLPAPGEKNTAKLSTHESLMQQYAGATYDREEISAFQYYSTSEGCQSINSGLRQAKVEQVARQQGRINAMDRAMARHPIKEDVVVARGVKEKTLKEILKVGEGGEWPDLGFPSTSTSHGTAASFGAGSATLIITVPKGVPAAYLEANGLTRYTGEKELVLARGLKYRIHKITRTKGTYDRFYTRVEVEVVVPGRPLLKPVDASKPSGKRKLVNEVEVGGVKFAKGDVVMSADGSGTWGKVVGFTADSKGRYMLKIRWEGTSKRVTKLAEKMVKLEKAPGPGEPPMISGKPDIKAHPPVLAPKPAPVQPSGPSLELVQNTFKIGDGATDGVHSYVVLGYDTSGGKVMLRVRNVKNEAESLVDPTHVNSTASYFKVGDVVDTPYGPMTITKVPSGSEILYDLKDSKGLATVFKPSDLSKPKNAPSPSGLYPKFKVEDKVNTSYGEATITKVPGGQYTTYQVKLGNGSLQVVNPGELSEVAPKPIAPTPSASTSLEGLAPGDEVMLSNGTKGKITGFTSGGGKTSAKVKVQLADGKVVYKKPSAIKKLPGGQTFAIGEKVHTSSGFDATIVNFKDGMYTVQTDGGLTFQVGGELLEAAQSNFAAVHALSQYKVGDEVLDTAYGAKGKVIGVFENSDGTFTYSVETGDGAVHQIHEMELSKFEPKFKVGDSVMTPSGKIGTVTSYTSDGKALIEFPDEDFQPAVALSDLKPAEHPPVSSETKYAVGDQVQTGSNKTKGVVIQVHPDGQVTVSWENGNVTTVSQNAMMEKVPLPPFGVGDTVTTPLGFPAKVIETSVSPSGKLEAKIQYNDGSTHWYATDELKKPPTAKDFPVGSFVKTSGGLTWKVIGHKKIDGQVYAHLLRVETGATTFELLTALKPVLKASVVRLTWR